MSDNKMTIDELCALITDEANDQLIVMSNKETTKGLDKAVEMIQENKLALERGMQKPLRFILSGHTAKYRPVHEWTYTLSTKMGKHDIPVEFRPYARTRNEWTSWAKSLGLTCEFIES